MHGPSGDHGQSATVGHKKVQKPEEGELNKWEVMEEWEFALVKLSRVSRLAKDLHVQVRQTFVFSWGHCEKEKKSSLTTLVI